MTVGSDQPDTTWGDDDRQLATVARNVSTRYVAIILDALIGLVLLPFNVHHLGQSAYGLWMLTASMTTYFSVLDLGFGGAIVKFVAQYRARRDVNGLNDIASTLAASRRQASSGNGSEQLRNASQAALTH